MKTDNLPEELRYTRTHEWARLDDDGIITTGITEYAQKQLGEIVFVDLPEVETEVQAEDECAVVESVKAASDIYAPISGQIIAVNDALQADPALVNQDPYGEGWLFKIKPLMEEDFEELLSADDYKEQISSDTH